ncbi:hypothetical protein HFO17_28060 [Rhizobium laguerreae]|uniref:hypothetical protein n=1 Tax=Rhizobium laguerreae TaxID=1076926 RepID=UPI001C91B966|nr:hypothetical protein [Rhizobium laguerreae]MBY3238350.1 hypothetical protein [Rhizobium laguerreae]
MFFFDVPNLAIAELVIRVSRRNWSVLVESGQLCCCLLASAPSSCCDLAVHLNVSAEKGAFVGLTGLAAGGLTVFHAA